MLTCSVVLVKGQTCANNPSIQQGDVNPAPLIFGQPGEISFSFFENLLDYTDEENDPVSITVCMLNLEPINGTASVGGNFDQVFDWVYDSTSNCLQGVQNQDIYGGTGGWISVNVNVKNFKACPNNQIGFIANLQPAACMNGANQTTDDNESVYTCSIMDTTVVIPPDTTFIDTTISPVGIFQPVVKWDKPIEMKVFPNPVQTIAFVEIKGEPLYANNLIVTNINGESILEKKIVLYQKNHIEEVDLSGFPDGTYFISVRENEIVRNVKKIIKVEG